jgi:hypothetical protein
LIFQSAPEFASLLLIFKGCVPSALRLGVGALDGGCANYFSTGQRHKDLLVK